MLYAITWGADEHLLDAKIYRAIEKAWSGILHHAYADGRLGSIQQPFTEFAHYLPGSSYNYDVGGYLLATSELSAWPSEAGTLRSSTGNARQTSGFLPCCPFRFPDPFRP